MIMSRPEIIGREIRAGITRKALRHDQTAVKAHMSEATLNRRLKDPGRLTLSEICQLEKVLGIRILNPELKN